MKLCPSCNLLKLIDDFSVGRKICKPCRNLQDRMHYRENPEKRDNLLCRNKRNRAANKERNSKGYSTAARALERARISRRAPKWVKLKDFKDLYEKAFRTGLVVDHIIPMYGKNVCGLHVPSNLQLLDKETNAIKSNKYPCVVIVLRNPVVSLVKRAAATKLFCHACPHKPKHYGPTGANKCLYPC